MKKGEYKDGRGDYYLTEGLRDYGAKACGKPVGSVSHGFRRVCSLPLGHKGACRP